MTESKVENWVNTMLDEVSQLEEKKRKAILERCGRSCCSSFDAPAQIEALRKELPENSSIDQIYQAYKNKYYQNSNWLKKDGKVITLEYHSCGCPLVESMNQLNPVLCDCTMGYTKAIFETLFNQHVKVDLKESMLRGSEKCRLVIEL